MKITPNGLLSLLAAFAVEELRKAEASPDVAFALDHALIAQRDPDDYLIERSFLGNQGGALNDDSLRGFGATSQSWRVTVKRKVRSDSAEAYTIFAFGYSDNVSGSGVADLRINRLNGQPVWNRLSYNHGFTPEEQAQFSLA